MLNSVSWGVIASQGGPTAPDLRPKNIRPPSIIGEPIVGEIGVFDPGDWTGADSIFWEYTVGGVTYGTETPEIIFQEAWIGQQVLLTIRASNIHGTTIATYLSDPVQPAVQVPGWNPTVIPSGITGVSQFHPNSQNAVLDENGRVISCPDIHGLADATNTVGSGPLQLVDELGRKYWAFDSQQFLNIAETFAATGRNFSVFAVTRPHRSGTNDILTRLGQQGGSTVAMMDVSGQGGGIAAIRAGGRALTSAIEGWGDVIVGSELSVIGAVCRTTGNGGNLCFVNRGEARAAQSGANTAVSGVVIGGVIASQNNNYQHSVYELIIIDHGETDIIGRSIHEAQCNNYDRVKPTRQFLIEGDSTMEGTNLIIVRLNAGMMMTAPDLVPANARVVNISQSGSHVASYRTRRDGANGWATTLRDENYMILMTGTNDIGSQGKTVQETYDDIVLFVKENCAMGVKTMVCINIAGGVGVMALREMLASPQFITDCEGYPGQLYENMVTTCPVHLIEHDGERRFFDGGDRQNRTYYMADSIHLAQLGAEILGTGGETPDFGIRRLYSFPLPDPPIPPDPSDATVWSFQDAVSPFAANDGTLLTTFGGGWDPVMEDGYMWLPQYKAMKTPALGITEFDKAEISLDIKMSERLNNDIINFGEGAFALLIGWANDNFNLVGRVGGDPGGVEVVAAYTTDPVNIRVLWEEGTLSIFLDDVLQDSVTCPKPVITPEHFMEVNSYQEDTNTSRNIRIQNLKMEFA